MGLTTSASPGLWWLGPRVVRFGAKTGGLFLGLGLRVEGLEPRV